VLAGAVEGATASRGVRGVFAVRLLASFGLRVFWGVRSMGILPAYPALVGGAREGVEVDHWAVAGRNRVDGDC
jgi:hypothetical protein